jgi:hypothetical protein
VSDRKKIHWKPSQFRLLFFPTNFGCSSQFFPLKMSNSFYSTSWVFPWTWIMKIILIILPVDVKIKHFYHQHIKLNCKVKNKHFCWSLSHDRTSKKEFYIFKWKKLKTSSFIYSLLETLWLYLQIIISWMFYFYCFTNLLTRPF